VPRRRTVLIVVGAIAAVAIGVGVLVYEELDATVRRAIEARGSALTHTAVRVDSVHVSLADGTATLRGLTIANPEGFAAANVFELAEISARIDVSSAFADPLVFREIHIAGPRVTCELNADGVSNVEVIRRTAEGASHPREPGPAGESQSGSERRGSGERRLIIDRLTVSDGAVSVDARAIGGPQQTESLPGFDLNEIGTQQGGVPPAEAGRLIITALARDVAVAVAATELERFIGKALGGRAGDALKKGGAEAIHKGLGTVLDQLLRPHKGARDAEHP
jgi:hypothetical protein